MLQTPGLEELKKDTAYPMAIAQHYGLATPFMDFTTSPAVAGFFASSEKPDPNTTSCLCCLDTADLMEVWSWVRSMLPHYPEVNLIKVEVPNLWRLEAQHGVFVECLSNWTAAYPLDRIEFPAGPPLPFPTPQEIYPAKKSQLEILLDHHFASERLADAGEWLREQFPDADMLELRGPDGGFFEEYFVPGGLPEREEWGRQNPWLAVPTEKYAETVTGEIALKVHLRMQPDVLFEAVRIEMQQILGIRPDLRKKAVQWALRPKGRIPRRLREGLEALWNGLRTLPYSDDQLVGVVAFCFQLYRLGYTRGDKSAGRETVARVCLGPVLEVEFSSREGNPVRAFASCENLLAAVRPDIADFLREEHKQHAGHISPLLQLCHNHRRSFQFEKFTDVFVRQIVPLQVLGERAKACHYSPPRLHGFGLP